MVQRRRHGRIRAPKPSRSGRFKSYKIVCAGCGKEIVVQVPYRLIKNYCVWSASKNRDILLWSLLLRRLSCLFAHPLLKMGKGLTASIDLFISNVSAEISLVMLSPERKF